MICKGGLNMNINNNERILLGHNREGRPVWATRKDIYNNALGQEASGMKAHYSFYDYKTLKTLTPPGFLVWSLTDYCGIVYRRPEDNKLILITGVQGDFVYN